MNILGPYFLCFSYVSQITMNPHCLSRASSYSMSFRLTTAIPKFQFSARPLYKSSSTICMFFLCLECTSLPFSVHLSVPECLSLLNLPIKIMVSYLARHQNKNTHENMRCFRASPKLSAIDRHLLTEGKSEMRRKTLRES